MTPHRATPEELARARDLLGALYSIPHSDDAAACHLRADAMNAIRGWIVFAEDTRGPSESLDARIGRVREYFTRVGQPVPKCLQEAAHVA